VAIKPFRHRGPQIKKPRADVLAKLERQKTRPADMPNCVDCGMQTTDLAVLGYDSKWRCLIHDRQHQQDVLRQSGDSAPLPSHETKPVLAKYDIRAEAERQRRGRAILEKYGLEKKS
jgi:hypothetical protein